MQKAVATKLKAVEDAKAEAAIAKCERTLLGVFKQIEQDQAEIEQLRKQTRAMLAELNAA